MASMKTILLSVVLSAAAIAESAPKPIPADKHEAISKILLRIEAAQIQYEHAQAELQKAQAEWSTELSALQKEYDAPGCYPDVYTKAWNCPPSAPSAAPAKK